jgi:hypothetical protein
MIPAGPWTRSAGVRLRLTADHVRPVGAQPISTQEGNDGQRMAQLEVHCLAGRVGVVTSAHVRP